MDKIKIGIIGVGNCASSLLQGIQYYKEHGEISGIMHQDIGGYKPSDIEIRLAFDVDSRKVNKNINEAIFALPNCTKSICTKMPQSDVYVKMGKVLDGCAPHMLADSPNTFCLSNEKQPDVNEVVSLIKETGVDMLINYLPVGSQKATEFYAECALEAGVGFINNIPVFIASDETWEKRFADKNIPIIGDDTKSQFGATILHRTLMEICRKRGVEITKSYQLNVGGNSDFLNMLDRSRLISKKISKTEAVQSIGKISNYKENLHVGPSDHVPFLKDNKLCFIRIEGTIWGDLPIEMDIKLSVEDSANSAGVVIDVIRCCKLALNNGIGGALPEVSAYYCKHPKEQIADSIAYERVESFIKRLSHVS